MPAAGTITLMLEEIFSDPSMTQESYKASHKSVLVPKGRPSQKERVWVLTATEHITGAINTRPSFALNYTFLPAATMLHTACASAPL